jgi:hypothetical protein
VAISAESPTGRAWWRPDGRAYVGEVFENEGSKVYPNEAQQARDFVFRTEGLPADASQPTFAFDSPANMAGGGHPIRRGEHVPDHYFLSAALQAKGGTVTARAGVAIGPWETLHEHAAPSFGSASFRHEGVDWVVSFLTPVEKAGGGFVVGVTHTATDLQTRVVVVDGAGKEHLSSNAQRNTYGDSTQLSVTFQEPPLSEVKAFRLQTRAYTWAQFENVALNPQQSSPKLKTQE